MSDPLVVNDRITIPARDLAWTAVRASGPGGQNVNKVSSKVELRFDVSACEVLDGETKRRLRAAARSDADGQIIVVSQKTRDQRQNLEDTREKLRLLIVAALFREKPRRATKPSRRAKARRLDAKSKHGDKKKARGKSFED